MSQTNIIVFKVIPLEVGILINQGVLFSASLDIRTGLLYTHDGEQTVYVDILLDIFSCFTNFQQID